MTFSYLHIPDLLHEVFSHLVKSALLAVTAMLLAMIFLFYGIKAVVCIVIFEQTDQMLFLFFVKPERRFYLPPTYAFADWSSHGTKPVPLHMGHLTSCHENPCPSFEGFNTL